MHLRKDQSLDELADVGNVAQFVSFTPGSDGPEQAYARLLGEQPNVRFASPERAIAATLAASSEQSINVRSYTPESPRSREFIYGLRTVEDAVSAVYRLSSEGLHTIVNETVDVRDGGVSGVVQAGVMEFAPDDTPRCVEKPGVASLPLDLGMRLLQAVYGFSPDLAGVDGRVEFSIHPRRRGWRGTHTLLWEREPADGTAALATCAWPNLFSRHIGDKLYGLLMAELSGACVPLTIAFPRRVAPFSFGNATRSAETWIRTCPVEQQPGLYTTHKGWLDPFALLSREDPEGTQIASVLAQAGVHAEHSGASIVAGDGGTIVEGVKGEGDAFMLGTHALETLPSNVIHDVAAEATKLQSSFGPVRTEWVHDGNKVWIVQLHQGATTSVDRVLVPGERANWVGFPISLGLEELRALLDRVNRDEGIQLIGDVGMTSHIADLVRKSGVPTRIMATNP